MLPQATVIDMSMTEEQVERVATNAAKKAIEDLFEIFGVDVSTKEGRKAIAEDFGFMRTARQGSFRFKMATLGALATSIATGVGYLIWLGLKSFMAIGIAVVK